MIKLGTGVLTWAAPERRSDRYGTVYLMEEGHDSLTSKASPSQIDKEVVFKLLGETPLTGAKGRLVVKVLETRQSTHIGDLARGIYPSVPEKGAEIVLGDGELFYDNTYAGGIEVGLKPDDGRDSDWLDPHKLYKVHEQTVELYFDPRGQA